jgi:hypothetical protein
MLYDFLIDLWAGTSVMGVAHRGCGNNRSVSHGG